MSFAAQRAADAEFILSRSDSEFGVSVDFWDSDLDPEEDVATATVRGVHFGKAADRREDKDGQAEQRSVVVSIPKSLLASIDDQGWMQVNGRLYSIESVHDDDLITWMVKGCRDEPTKHGDASRLFGG